MTMKNSDTQVIVVVIPAFNEEATIGNVIDDLFEQGYIHIVIVDDGSTDRTSDEILKHLNKGYYLRHPINCGQGAALSTGIKFALHLGADIIITFDADGQHMAAEIQDLVAELNEGQYDVILGSRFLFKQSIGMPFSKYIMLKIGLFITKLFYGILLTDTHNGLRALSRSAAQKINITEFDMVHASQIFEEIKRNQLRYKEVAVTIKYTDYSLAKGQPLLNSIKIFIKMLRRKLI
jgi:glycosyltransferase involved in cell wall biosynthesis